MSSAATVARTNVSGSRSWELNLLRLRSFPTVPMKVCVTN